MKIERCPIDNNEESRVFVDLGMVPLVNNLCDSREESINVKRFPLAVQLFTRSRLACLTEVIDKELLFRNYVYQSGINKPFISHCADMYHYLEYFLGWSFGQGSVIVDIGGNDGALLKEFRRINSLPQYINIDASRSFIEMNESAGIKYVNEWFDEKFILPGGVDLFVSTNVFQHTIDIRSFVRGVRRNLNPRGVWCLEFPYLLGTLLNENYDQIYHEHIYYYLLCNIYDLLIQEGMKVISVSFHEVHSGTLRVLSVRENDKRDMDHSVPSFMNLEKVLTPDYYSRWGKRMLQKIVEFREFIEDLFFEGAAIACFGAAAKGCVFLNTCGLDDSKILFIIDDTPYKQDKYVPGTGLKIVSREVLSVVKIDYLIILAHNFKDYIIRSLSGQYDGKYIIMFPDIQIL
jgi:novobiocin biosynthesis protein NovU/D-mycarose 3-C-methyltransferase